MKTPFASGTSRSPEPRLIGGVSILSLAGLIGLLAGCASEPASHVVSAPPPPPPSTAPAVYTAPAGGVVYVNPAAAVTGNV
ncbi:MAG: hypothetical protein ABIR80_07590, partial [Opitutaceae bacterium]